MNFYFHYKISRAVEGLLDKSLNFLFVPVASFSEEVDATFPEDRALENAGGGLLPGCAEVVVELLAPFTWSWIFLKALKKGRWK